MKYIIILLTILTSPSSFGRETFPGVEYSYVKIFLFNIEANHMDRPDSYIYKNGEFAETKIGDGTILPNTKVALLNKVLNEDINTMLMGLSNCFIPRYGIIYYDGANKPVASVSLCFECEKISIWSENYSLPKVNHKNIHVEKAEKSFAFIKNKVVKGALPIFEDKNEYHLFIRNNEDYRHLGETTITYSDTINILSDSLSLYRINHWFVADDKARLSELGKITAGGEKHKFLKLVYYESTFMFDSNDEKAILGEAMIINSGIWLPNNVAIGMSLDNVMGSFPIYDGISYPEIIRLKNKYQEVVYWFEKRTLKKINIYVYQ